MPSKTKATLVTRAFMSENRTVASGWQQKAVANLVEKYIGFAGGNRKYLDRNLVGIDIIFRPAAHRIS